MNQFLSGEPCPRRTVRAGTRSSHALPLVEAAGPGAHSQTAGFICFPGGAAGAHAPHASPGQLFEERC